MNFIGTIKCSDRGNRRKCALTACAFSAASFAEVSLVMDISISSWPTSSSLWQETHIPG